MSNKLILKATDREPAELTFESRGEIVRGPVHSPVRGYKIKLSMVCSAPPVAIAGNT